MTDVLNAAEIKNPDTWNVTGGYYPRVRVDELFGGFDEEHSVINNDLDFCLRAHRAGLLTVYTPYAALTHYELASRANLKDVFDLSHFNAAWKTTFAAGDPYFNPRLSRHADDFRPDDEPVQWVVSGAPMFLIGGSLLVAGEKLLARCTEFVAAADHVRRCDDSSLQRAAQ